MFGGRDRDRNQVNAAALQEWFGRFRGVDVDVELAGVPLGGKPGESPQRPQAYSFDGVMVEMHFHPTEVLTVVHPTTIDLGHAGNAGKRDILIIADALEVRFGWHYYGRPQTPDNWCTETYRFEGDVVACTVTGPIRPVLPDATFQRGGAPAVRLVPLSDRDTVLRSAREAARSPYPDVRERAIEWLKLFGDA